MTYLFAAYSVVFVIIFLYTLVQGKRLYALTKEVKHLQELEETVRSKQIG